LLVVPFVLFAARSRNFCFGLCHFFSHVPGRDLGDDHVVFFGVAVSRFNGHFFSPRLMWFFGFCGGGGLSPVLSLTSLYLFFCLNRPQKPTHVASHTTLFFIRIARFFFCTGYPVKPSTAIRLAEINQWGFVFLLATSIPSGLFCVLGDLVFGFLYPEARSFTSFPICNPPILTGCFFVLIGTLRSLFSPFSLICFRRASDSPFSDSCRCDSFTSPLRANNVEARPVFFPLLFPPGISRTIPALSRSTKHSFLCPSPFHPPREPLSLFGASFFLEFDLSGVGRTPTLLPPPSERRCSGHFVFVLACFPSARPFLPRFFVFPSILDFFCGHAGLGGVF